MEGGLYMSATSAKRRGSADGAFEELYSEKRRGMGVEVWDCSWAVSQ